MDFAAPTVEYIQKDFESDEGFFCDNKDTYVLHVNDDDRYKTTTENWLLGMMHSE